MASKAELIAPFAPLADWRRHAVPLLVFALLFPVALWPIEIAPGIELMLAPLFSALALRYLGARWALAVTAAYFAPTIWWWGHPYSMIAALLQIGTIDYVSRRWRLSYFLANLIYYATLGLAVSAIVLLLLFENPFEIAVILFVKKLVNESLLFAAADCLILFVAFQPRFPFLTVQRAISITTAITAIPILLIMVMAMVSFANRAYSLNAELRDYPARVESSVRSHFFSHPVPTNGVPITIPGPYENQQVLAFDQPPGDRINALQQRLGCQRTQINQPQGIESYRYFDWTEVCLIQTVNLGERTIRYMYSPRLELLRGYRLMLINLFFTLTALILIIPFHRLMRRRIDETIAAVEEQLANFGRIQAPVGPQRLFSEVEAPLKQLGRMSSAFMRAVDQRNTAFATLEELRQDLDVSIGHSVRYNANQGLLTLLTIDTQGQEQVRQFPIHPVDQSVFRDKRLEENVSIEFRLAGEDEDQWHVFIGRPNIGAGHWQTGVVVPLSRPSWLLHDIPHKARLIELGSMASALSHELKQPLFTIALAAENGRFAIGPAEGAEASRTRRKFDRILDQVERAKQIIENTLGYARQSDTQSESSEVSASIRSVLSLMRPMLVRANVGLVEPVIEQDATIVGLAPISFEQLLQNALQNAIDAIAEARTLGMDCTGVIGIAVNRTDDGGIAVSIRDDGKGLTEAEARIALDAFATTKQRGSGTGLGLFICRQIVERAGGTLSLSGRSDSRGAEFRLVFPANRVRWR